MKSKYELTYHSGVHITGTSAEGLGVGRLNEGKVVFVKGAIPGDTVDISVHVSKKKFGIAMMEKLVVASSDRVTPACTHFGTCGGCKWQHQAYTAQLASKQQQVTDALQRIGGLSFPTPAPILGSALAYGYRNRLDFAVSNLRWIEKAVLETTPEQKNIPAIGFHLPRAFDKVLPITDCKLMDDVQNQIRNGLHTYALTQGIPYFDIKAKTGLLRGLLIRNTTLNQLMVMVMFYQDQTEEITKIMDYLATTFPAITSLLYTINPKANDTFYDLPITTYKGQDHIVEQLGSIQYRINPKAFFQTNPTQAKVLFDVVADFCNLQGHETVYDLYTGTGSIALYLAQKAKKIVGIELVPEAIVDAKANAQFNAITNCTFETGDMAKLFTQDFIAQHGKPDVLVTDPPRAGMHESVVQQLLTLAVPKIVYVSCNPATQARDLALLAEKYTITALQPVDMFPHTSHVENVALLTLTNHG